MLEKSSDVAEAENEINWKAKLVGVGLSFLSAFMLLILNTIVKYKKLHFNDVLLVRAVLQTIFGLFLLAMNGESVWIKDVDVGKNIYKLRFILFSYGFFGALFISSNYIAIYFMPLGDAMTIILSSVLPTMILSAIFLKERLRLYKSSCAILVVAGIVLVIRPPFIFENSTKLVMDQTSHNMKQNFINQTSTAKSAHSIQIDNPRDHCYYTGAIAALVCMMSTATYRIMMKVLVQNKSTSSFAIPLFYVSIAILIAASVIPVFGGDQRILFPSKMVNKYDNWQWIFLFVATILGIAQHITHFEASRLISPTLASFIRSSEIVVSYIVQTTLFNTEPSLTSLIGSGLVMIACIGVVLENWVISIISPTMRDYF